jgi:hypothetical protein
LIKLRISCDLAEISVRIGIVFLFIINSFDVQAKKRQKLHTRALNITSGIPIVNRSGRFLKLFWWGKDLLVPFAEYLDSLSRCLESASGVR